MSIRAVIFDVYGTLLEVGPPPPDAAARWTILFKETMQTEPPMTLTEFTTACAKVISEMHQVARACGITWPEVNWPVVVTTVIPQLKQLSPNAQQRFLLQQIQTIRTTQMCSAAAEVLRWLKKVGCVLGIASNSQTYTLHELQTGLAAHGLTLELFEPALCFWSFEHGFSKPDPHVFRILTVRLEARCINPTQTVMVGDQLETDIVPARAMGWLTWLLGAPCPEQGGHWPAFKAWIESNLQHE